jgi:signal peptidase II
MKRYWKYFLIALVVLALDQATKLGVYYNMEIGLLGQIKLLGNWFKLFYTLNPGMAFGIEFGFKYDKVVLTITRIVAIFMIGRHIIQLAQTPRSASSLLWGWTLILGGACGNAVDSIFYGKLLHNAPYQAPMSWFYGQVIDMLYLDIWSGQLPSWLPWVGGQHMLLFPVFNLADLAILAGVALLIFAKKPIEAAFEKRLSQDHSTNASTEKAETSISKIDQV